MTRAEREFGREIDDAIHEARGAGMTDDKIADVLADRAADVRDSEPLSALFGGGEDGG